MDNYFFQTYAQTEAWLIKKGITHYTIHDDLTVDVNDSVNLNSVMGLNYIPVQFGFVNGDFSCSGNNLLSLKGSPIKVNGVFYTDSNELVNLEYLPQKGLQGLSCSSNKLKSLKGCPEILLGFFACDENRLKSLEGAPKEIQGHFNCEKNNLKTLEHSPQKGITNMTCGRNKLISLKGAPREIQGNFDCEKNQLLNLEHLPKGVEYLYAIKNPFEEVLSVLLEQENIHTLAINPIQELEDFNIPTYQIKEYGYMYLEIPRTDLNAFLLTKKLNHSLPEKKEKGKLKI